MFTSNSTHVASVKISKSLERNYRCTSKNLKVSRKDVLKIILFKMRFEKIQIDRGVQLDQVQIAVDCLGVH